MQTNLALKELYLLTIEEIARLERLISDHGMEISSLTRKLQRFKEAKLSLNSEVCQQCSGYGEIREWIFQDESRLVKCVKCGGTGLPK